MSTSNKSKLYLLIIGILLLTNIAMLLFFHGHRKDQGKKDNRDKEVFTKAFLENDIGFNAQQLAQYDSLKKQNKEKMKTAFDSFKRNKKAQLKYLGSTGFSDTAIANTVSQSLQNQKNMEYQMLNYFVSIRKLCTANQMPKFDSLFYKIMDRKPVDNK